MQSLASQATHWRATTSFINYGVDYTDYIRGNFSTFDVMNYEGYGDCKDVEYINIRGTHGTHTKASFWQRRDLNLLNVYSCSPACAFKAVNCTSTESSFGSYCEASNSANPRFRGTMNDNSTTEWWFGGYL
jgi:hemolysin activation/secretion protein